MFCQNNIKKNKRVLHYGQLVMCMYEVKAKLLEYNKQNPDFVTEIHCPKFGTGIFGGNWNFISDLIIDIWPEYKIFVYNRLTERNENA